MFDTQTAQQIARLVRKTVREELVRLPETREAEGVRIDLSFDDDGYPQVSIDTQGGYLEGFRRPSVEVRINGVVVHEMLDPEENDIRWAKGDSEEE